MSISDSVDEQGKTQAQSSGGGAARLRTNNFHAQVDMSGMQQRAEKVATEQEDAVNMQLASGKGFGTTGIKGMTDAQVNALSTDALIKNVNDTLSTGVGTLSRTAFGVGDFSTAGKDLLNSISDTEHVKGDPNYKPGMLDRVQDRMVKTADDINSVADEAMKTTDPKRLNELLAKMTELQVEFRRLMKEEEKLQAIQRLVTQLMLGCPSAGAINKLRELGLGALVEELLRAFVSSMRKQGKMSPQIIAVLQSAGFGALVAFDAADQKRTEAIHDQATLDDLASPAATGDAQAGATQLAHGDTRTGGQSAGPARRPAISGRI